MSPPDTDGWQEWSKHVLLELERLDKTIQGMDQNIRKMEQQITALRVELAIKSGVWGLIGGLIPVAIIVGMKYFGQGR